MSAFSEPVLQSEGTLAVDWETGEITLDTWFTMGWLTETLQSTVAIHAVETGIDSVEAAFAVALPGSSASHLVASFDPLSAAFIRAEVGLEVPLQGITLTLTGVLEPGSAGVAIDLASTADTIWQQLTLGFNLDRFGGLQTVSCALPLSYADVRFTFPIDVYDLDAGIRLDRSGFGQLTLSAPQVGGLPFGVSFGAFLTFTREEKALEIVSSLSLDSPDCFDLYIGFEWDTASRTLSELRLYGIGYRCEIGEVGARLLFSLDPSAIALVKSPYQSLLGIVWPMVGCCGQAGEGSLAFFFGEDTLFDLGEIAAEVTLPVSESLTLSVAVNYPMAGLPTFTLRWAAGS